MFLKIKLTQGIRFLNVNEVRWIDPDSNGYRVELIDGNSLYTEDEDFEEQLEKFLLCKS